MNLFEFAFFSLMGVAVITLYGNVASKYYDVMEEVEEIKRHVCYIESRADDILTRVKFIEAQKLAETKAAAMKPLNNSLKSTKTV